MNSGALAETRISGLRELLRALNKINREVANEVKEELKTAAEPVRALAESYAFGGIRNIGNEWGEMRLGVSLAQGSVYIVPARRNSGGSPRPNLGTLLLDEAMLPALAKKQDSVVEAVGDAFDRLAFRSGFH